MNFPPMQTARRVVNHKDAALQTLARSFLELFYEHCKRNHGSEKFVDSDCPVCTFVITGRTG